MIRIFSISLALLAMVTMLQPETVEAGSRVSGCDGSLVEDFIKNKCVSGSNSSSGGGGSDSSFPADCGDEGERPCTLVEHIPSCKDGLVENFLDNQCVQPGDGTQLDDIIAEFVIPDCGPILGELAEPTINNLYNFKLVTGIPALLAQEVVPKDTVATPARVAAALAYLAIFYCELTLERDVAQDGADFQADKFEEVLIQIKGLFDFVQVSASLTADRDAELSGKVSSLESELSNQHSAIEAKLMSHDAQIKTLLNAHDQRTQAAVSAHDSAIAGQVATHDTSISNQVGAHDASVKAAIADHDANIAGKLSAHDVEIKAALETLRSELQSKLADIEKLLLTPQGRRPGFNAK
jgi:hypothetical protein